MKRGTGRVVSVAGMALALSAGGAAATEPEDMARVRVRCPELFVESFPMIVAVTLENIDKAKYSGIVQKEQTLASRGVEGIRLVFYLTGAGGEKLQVGHYGSGYPDIDWHSDRKNHALTFGEELSLTFDLRQLWLPRHPKRPRRLPWAGEWSVTVKQTLFGVSSEPCEVTVRPPTEEEQEFVRKLKPRKVTRRDHRWGSEHSWFPDVILDKGEIPDAGRLPIETRRVVELIRILRATVRSPEAALEAISRLDMDWGYLRPLIDAHRYECFLAGGKKERAEALRAAALEGNEDAAGHFLLVDKGGGLLARLEDLKKRQEAFEKRRREGGGTSKAGGSATGLIAAGTLALVACAGAGTWLVARRKGRRAHPSC